MKGEKTALSGWDGEVVNLEEWSEDFDQRRRLENRNLWRRHHFDLARIHYSLAEQHRRLAFSFGAKEDEKHDKGDAA